MSLGGGYITTSFAFAIAWLLFSVRFATRRDLFSLKIAPHDRLLSLRSLIGRSKRLAHEILQYSKRYTSSYLFGCDPMQNPCVCLAETILGDDHRILRAALCKRLERGATLGRKNVRAEESSKNELLLQ